MTLAVYDLTANKAQYRMTVGSTEFHITKFEVSEAICSPGYLRASLVGYDASLDLQDMIGKSAQLEIDHGTDDNLQSRSFYGIVQHFELRGTDDSAAYFEVVIVPKLWMLGLKFRSRVHVTDSSQNANVQTVIESIMKDGGLQSQVEFQLSRSYDPYSFLAQYHQTDLNFIQYLCEREGICYCVDHRSDQEYYVFTDHSEDLPDVSPFDEILVRRSSGALMDQHESIEHFTCRHQMTFGKAEFRDYDFKNANRRIFDSSTGLSDQKNEYYFDTPGFADQNALKPQLQRLAQNRTDAFDASVVEGSGFGDYRALTSGKLFSAVGAASQSLNRKWLCTSIQYEGTEGSHVDQDNSAMGAGGRSYRMSFTSIPSDVTYRPLAKTPAPRVQGAADCDCRRAGWRGNLYRSVWSGENSTPLGSPAGKRQTRSRSKL